MGRRSRRARGPGQAPNPDSNGGGHTVAAPDDHGKLGDMDDRKNVADPEDDGDGSSEAPLPTADDVLDDDEDMDMASVDTVAASESALSELADLRGKLKVKQDQFLRLAADCENIKRRSRLASEQAQNAFKDKLFGRFLPIIDAVERARQAVADGEDLEHLRDGLVQIGALFESALQDLGVKVMPVVGEAFDPRLHEAMMHSPAPGARPGTVTLELQKGYYIDDRVLRHARVAVAPDGPAGAPSADERADEGEEAGAPAPDDDLARDADEILDAEVEALADDEQDEEQDEDEA